MIETKLLPCPFCGGEAFIAIEKQCDGNVVYETKSVACSKCGVSTEKIICDGYYYCYYTDEEAIKAWNTRKPMEQIVEMLEDDIAENPEASLREYRSGLYKAIEIVKEVGGSVD